MDEEPRREIARRGGERSHGGRGYDEDRYSSRSRDDEDRGYSSRYGRRGFASMDEDRRRQIAHEGGEASYRSQRRDEYGHFAGHGGGYEGYRGRSEGTYRERDEEGRFMSGRGGRGYEYDEGRGASRGGGRGFAGMDPERQREIARMGGRASYGGRGREYDEDRYEGRGGRGFAGMDSERQREIASMGGRASYGGRGREYDEDRYQGRDYEDEQGSRRRSSGRGFASMDPERQREIASMGGRASHGGRGREYEEDRYESRGGDSGGRGRSSARGFATWDEDELREVARRGGHAAHESGHAHEWSSREAREAARQRWA